MKLYNVVEKNSYGKKGDLISLFMTDNTTEAAETLINDYIDDPEWEYTDEELYNLSEDALKNFDNKMWWKHEDSQREFFCVEIDVNE